MKKWIFLLLAVFIMTLLIIYLFIPAKIVISNIYTAETTITGALRYISKEGNWEKWWHDPNGQSHVRGEPFTYNGALFRLSKQVNNVTGIEIDKDGMKIESMITLISFKKDSIGAVWYCEIPAGNTPLTRILKYREALEIKKNITGVMKNFTFFISDPQNVYGLPIYRTSTRDTTLLSARFTSKTYPSTTELYGYFGAVEKSIQKQNGTKSGFPMMNVGILENGLYETEVAIPTNKWLKKDGRIITRRMVAGNFISTEVRGGLYTINEAKKQLDYFIADNNKSKIANPFQQLVTNRINEPDTLKWITRIYIPVVE